MAGVPGPEGPANDQPPPPPDDGPVKFERWTWTLFTTADESAVELWRDDDHRITVPLTNVQAELLLGHPHTLASAMEGFPGIRPELATTPPEAWTSEQAGQFAAEFDRLMTSGEHKPRLLPPTAADSAPVTHIAGPDIRVNAHLRQRCGWCGAVLCDYDLTRIAVPDGQDPTPATWAQGDLVRQDGNAWFTVDHEDGAELPDDACARIDPEVTA